MRLVLKILTYLYNKSPNPARSMLEIVHSAQPDMDKYATLAAGGPPRKRVATSGGCMDSALCAIPRGSARYFSALSFVTVQFDGAALLTSNGQKNDITLRCSVCVSGATMSARMVLQEYSAAGASYIGVSALAERKVLKWEQTVASHSGMFHKKGEIKMTQADLNIDLGHICALIGAGAPLGSPEPVTGGLLHRMWRVETQGGTFAVKVLNSEIMSRHNAKENFRTSERVAKIANGEGICAVIAKTVGDDPWIESNGSYVMVFDWVDGRTLLPEECTSEHARRIGEILFRIHSLNMVIDGLEPPTWSAIPEDTWKSHIAKARQSISCWELPWETLLHDVINWCRLFQDAAARLSKRLIISHGDLDSKNVIWNDEQTPYVIDWESAGYVNPTVELIEAALNWSRNQDGTSDKTRFQAVIQSYVQAGGSLYGNVLDALYGTLGGMLGWLEYNMRRSVDEDVFGGDERDLAQREVKQTAHQLKKLVGVVFDYAQWIEGISGWS